MYRTTPVTAIWSRCATFSRQLVNSLSVALLSHCLRIGLAGGAGCQCWQSVALYVESLHVQIPTMMMTLMLIGGQCLLCEQLARAELA